MFFVLQSIYIVLFKYLISCSMMEECWDIILISVNRELKFKTSTAFSPNCKFQKLLLWNLMKSYFLKIIIQWQFTI